MPSVKHQLNGFKIEKGIPVPVGLKENGVRAVVRRMEIGDSLLLPHVATSTVAHCLVAKMGIRIVARKLDSGGVRIWRVA